jgi:hypothetical protein
MTQADLIRQSRIDLDNAFLVKYPAGRFSIVRNPLIAGGFHTVLWWVPKRPTSHKIPRGVAIDENNGLSIFPRNSVNANSSHFADIDKFVKACQRRGIPEDRVGLFLHRVALWPDTTGMETWGL